MNYTLTAAEIDNQMVEKLQNKTLRITTSTVSVTTCSPLERIIKGQYQEIVVTFFANIDIFYIFATLQCLLS